MNQEPKFLEKELDGSDKSPSLQDCLKVPGNAIQMPVPLLLHLFLRHTWSYYKHTPDYLLQKKQILRIRRCI